jgi:hypothetical protein
LIKKRALLWSIVLYLAACALPALVFHIRSDLGAAGAVWSGYRPERGINLLAQGLVFGWIRANFTAFANPLLWLSWIMLARNRFSAARGLSLAALIVSIETLQLLFQPMLWDEAATQKGYLAAPHIGFVFWIASMWLVYWTSRQAENMGAALPE